ncbi:MAG: hypothetical protein IJ657_02770 [Acidaminococcaceae bacterium]|nr:hypothetical protein [Acidaminococcaceae bacterium]
MRRPKRYGRTIQALAAVLWLASFTVCPLHGEAAELPRRPVAAGGTVQRTSPQVIVQSEMKSASAPVTAVTGYTETEIRERMIKKYTQPRPAFRRVSGAAAGEDYRPGTMDVKIPNLFFPADELKDVSETFQENPDGTFGTRAPEDLSVQDSGYSAAAQQQLQEEQRQKAQERQTQMAQTAGQKGDVRQTEQVKPVKPPAGQQKPAIRNDPAVSGGKYKTITVQVNVPAPSPFRQLTAGDFRWFTNNKGSYAVGLLHSLPQDPLQGLPAEGPMIIRNAAQNEFMAVSVDDPADTYYYKNADTFPTYGKAVPVFTETRKTIQNSDMNIKYIRYFMGGQYCLIVDGSCERAGKTYRMAVVFPEEKQHEYLPKALYALENLKAL